MRVSNGGKSRHPEWMSDAGEIEWKLTIDKQISYNVGYGAGKAFREMQAFDMYWHAEGMKTAYSGICRQKLGQGFYITMALAFIQQSLQPCQKTKTYQQRI